MKEAYIIITGDSFSDLAGRVREKIEKGYIPVGGFIKVRDTPESSWGKTEYGQAMVLKSVMQ